MTGRSWKVSEINITQQIKQYLLEHGGQERGVRGINEVWRVKFSDSTFTYYKNGTLYSTPSRSDDPAVLEAWKYLDFLVGSYPPPTKDFLIGLDETGKGEAIGHIVLTGVIFPKEIFKHLDILLGPADTKKRHEFEYWDNIFRKLDLHRKEGLDFILETIPPWEVDEYNINKIMDITYQRILNMFFRKVKISKCRIVLDDYRVGHTLQRFLRFLENNGAEVIVTSHADSKYIEAKVASLISKRYREYQIKKINEDPRWRIGNLCVGTGNAGDLNTIKWLEEWYKYNKSWPWFVKRSFVTVRKIDGKLKPIKKVPPIRENLLSKEFLKEFNQGCFSIQSLSLVCPFCGLVLKNATFAIFEKNGRTISELRCPNCYEFIKDARFTLRYYCGYVIPDSSTIRRKLISHDLEASKIFEDFTIILVPVVRSECDGTPRGKEELEKLQLYHTQGRIKLECSGNVGAIPPGLSSTARDEEIIKACIEKNAILLTGDKSMSTFAVGKNVFTIFI